MSGARGRPWWVLALFGVLALAAAPGVLRLGLDSSPEVFFVRDAARLEEYRELRRTFGTTESLRVVVHGDDLWTVAGLTYLGALEETARAVPGVRETAGVHRRYAGLTREWPPGDLEEFRRRAIDDPLVRGAGWIDPEGTRAVVDLLLDRGEVPLPPQLEERLTAVPAPAGTRWELVGLPVVERALDASMRRLVRVNLPILVGAIAVLLLVRLGDPRHALPPLVFVGIVVLGLLGALGHLGVRLNLVSSVLVPLLTVIAVATAVHLQHTFLALRRRGESVESAIDEVLRRRGPAVTGAALTTAVAFGSFAVSPVPPVRSLGIALAAGSLWMLVAAWTLYPALLKTIAGRAPTGESSRRGDRLLGRWVDAGLRRPRATAVLFALAVLVFLAAAPRIRQQSGLLSYFSTDHPVRRALESADAAGVGTVTAELVLRLEGEAPEDSFRDPERLMRLAELGRSLREIPELRGVMGAGDLFQAALAEVVVEGEASRSARWLVLGLLQGGESRPLLDLYLAGDGRVTRSTLLLPLAGHRRLEPALDEAAARARRAFPEARVAITGELPLVLTVERRLLGTLASSLGVTLGLVALLLVVLLRSPGRAARALAPNLWPLAAVFGAMGWLDIGLDSTTVMSAAVVLGLSLDDTLHTLAEIGPRGRGSPAAVATAARAVAPAHLSTSLLLVSGFAICAVSDLAQTSRFCVLVSIGCLAALAADLFLLPLLLSVGRRRGDAPA